MSPEAFSVTAAAGDTTSTIDWDGGLQPWGTLEQGPVGEWWVTLGGDTTGSTSGPYLDHVQAMRALQAWEGS